MSDTTTSYEPYDWRRVCDECGMIFNRSRLHRHGPWIFCSECDQPGDRIREDEDAAIARQEPFRILPVPNAKPLTPDSPQILTAAEANIFNFIVQTAPASAQAGTTSTATNAAWAAIYLADIVNEGTRPDAWLTTARTKLASLLDYLLTQQYGSPTGTAGVASNPRYGGFLVSGQYLTATVIAAGLAFTKGYTALGTAEYLNGAKRCATFVRHVQCGHLQATAYTVYPAGGGAYQIGGLASSVSDSTGLLSASYTIGDIFGLYFLSELSDVVGAYATFGDTTSTAFFSAATSATMADMISTLGTFASTGPYSATTGTKVTGLSTTPTATYVAAVNGAGGAAAWTAAATIPSSQIALAMRGVYEASGVNSQLTTMLAWLAAFTANSANATPSTNTEQQTLNGITGTYDPSICVATTLQATAPFTETTGSTYSWASLGAISPILAETAPAQLGVSRNILNVGQPFSTFYLELKYLGMLGLSGLSLQPNSSATASVPNVTLAARAGEIYRQVISGN